MINWQINTNTIKIIEVNRHAFVYTYTYMNMQVYNDTLHIEDSIQGSSPQVILSDHQLPNSCRQVAGLTDRGVDVDGTEFELWRAK